MIESNLLHLVLNNCSISVRKDKQHYRLLISLYASKIYNLDLNKLLNKVSPECKFSFDIKRNRYYLEGKNALKVIELLDNTHKFSLVNNKVNVVLSNKELFSRSKGKKLTTEELNKLEELYLVV